MLPAHYNRKEPSYFCRFTFGQFFTILVLEIFTLFFIFYLGARYGGELLGVKPPAVPVAATPEGLPKLTTTDATVVQTTQDPEIKALAKDLLHSAPTPDLKKRVSEMLEESGSKKVPAALPKHPVELKTAPKPEPVIQTAPVKSHFSVQIGSYPNSDEAYMMVDQWKAKGYPAYLVSAEIPGKGRWYRVRLGGFDTKDSAKSYLDKLQKQEQVDAFVVTNE